MEAHPPSATEALRRLRDVNRRFVQNVRSVDSLLSQAARRSLVLGQVPIAIVLSCSDSRAPAELVFDQGPGDLFVVRVAGNIVDRARPAIADVVRREVDFFDGVPR